MRFLHVADLHVGKRVCEFPMIEDQRHALEQVVAMLERHEADCLLVAGDLYDKSQPSAEAVALVDWFLGSVAATGVPAVVIPGNHDSAERVAYAGGLLARQGIHMAPRFDGHVEPVRLEDGHGPVDVWPIPFVRPAEVRATLPGCEATDYTGAMDALVRSLPIDESVRNVAVVHQFVTATGSKTEGAGSEFNLGGLDNVEFGVFDPFEYVACGHVHRSQRVGRETCRYAGSLLKYSTSEWRDRKTLPLVELGPKGSEADISFVEVKPLRDLREIRGPLDDLLSDEVVAAANPEDYLRVVLTDRDPIANAMARLRDRYPNVMTLEYDNARSRSAGISPDAAAPVGEGVSALELFERFFEEQNGEAMTEAQHVAVAEELQGIDDGGVI